MTPHEEARRLLREGIGAYKDGDFNLARNSFERLCWTDPAQEDLCMAQYYLSLMEEDPVRKRQLLENILVTDPLHPEARRAMAVLDGRLDPEGAGDDPPTATPQEPLPVRARRYVCRNCGGRLRFSPEESYLHCDYCHTRTTLAQELERMHSDRSEDFMVALAQSKGHRAPILARSVTCPSCGADFALAPTALSLTCPYCASAIVLSAASMREWIPPYAILPFSLNQGQALSALNSWLSDRWAGERIKVQSLESLYVPAWSFDIAGKMSYHVPEEKVEQRDSPFHFSDRTSERSEWPIHYTGVLVSASHSLPMTLSGVISSFRIEDAKPFTPAMLADWPAQVYQVSPAEASLAAREQVLRAELRSAPRNPGGILSTAGIFVDTFQQYLLPVWFARFSNPKTELRAAINGQSGLVFGELRRQTGLLGRILGTG
jgi:DNA-directed RNA polymerase subunit RPC12/RpoP